ncbi:MAG: U32 family peptidase, partial [Actinomycetia bacterium]|nr:U32 family peptidase [Actinomycetes bacterium]
MDKVELLSPAGNFEKLKMALEFGADAVYVGAYKYSLRAKSMNLSFNEIEKALEYAHKMDRKVYIALNIFCRNSDLNEIEKYLNVISEMEVDGLIVSDKGLIRLIKEKFSKLDIILSTQANVMNKGSAKIWEDLGVKRVTLARELSLEEIKEITSSIDAEVEVFVHGSLCISYAGNCFLSLYITGRDSNRGECSQCCRWKYYLVKEGEKERFEILSDCDNSYILNSKDLCLAEYVPQLIKAG